MIKNNYLKNDNKNDGLKNQIYGWIMKIDTDTYNNLLTINTKKDILILFYMITKYKTKGQNTFGFKSKNILTENLKINELVNMDNLFISSKRKLLNKDMMKINDEILNHVKLINKIFSIGNLCLDFDYFKDRIKFIKMLEIVTKGSIFKKEWMNLNHLNSIIDWLIYFLEKNINYFYCEKRKTPFLKIKDYYFRNFLKEKVDEKYKHILIDYVEIAYKKLLDIKPIVLLNKYNNSEVLYDFNEDFIYYKLIFNLNKINDLKNLLKISKEDSISIIANSEITNLIDTYYIPTLSNFIGFQNIILRFIIIKFYDYLYLKKDLEFNDISTESNSKTNFKKSYKIGDTSFDESNIIFKNKKNNLRLKKKFLNKEEILSISKNCFFKTINAQLNNIILNNNFENSKIDKLKIKIINRIKHILESNFKEKSIIVFGSSYYNIKDKNSDIDLMVVNKNNEEIKNQIEFLKKINKKFKNYKFIINTKSIYNTNIPIIKIIATLKLDYIIQNEFFNIKNLEDYKNIKLDFKIDISCAQYNFNNSIPVGIRSSIFIKEKTINNQILRELLLIIKLFFSKNSLNDSYKGGINFYALTIILLTFDKVSKISEKNYFKNIIHFFNFLLMYQYLYYSIDLGYEMKNNNIIDIFRIKENYSSNLVIYDPTIEIKNNVAKNCFNFQKILEKILSWLEQYEKVLNEINNKLLYDIKVHDDQEIKFFYNNTISKIDLVNEIFN